MGLLAYLGASNEEIIAFINRPVDEFDPRPAWAGVYSFKLTDKTEGVYGRVGNKRKIIYSVLKEIEKGENEPKASL
ncbi:MAG: hypothetical protein KBA08_01685 [Firmicutes bacterium]|nr:hypothetical protein [Bacillota bacterium]